MRSAAACIIVLGIMCAPAGAVVPTTTHGPDATSLNGMIKTGDLISGQIGTELAPLLGWHPANTVPADQLSAFTDDAGILASGLTGLLTDFPGTGTPAKTVQYEAPNPLGWDIQSIGILSGNNGKDGRVFSTTVIRYSTNNGQTFNLLGYFQSDPSGTTNNGQWGSTYVEIDDGGIGGFILSGVTHLVFELYAVDNTQNVMRDPFDGVNPFTGVDDELTAAFVAPLIFELDVVGVVVPEPAHLVLPLAGLLALRRRAAGALHHRRG